MPTTRRVPEEVPMPAMAPSNVSMPTTVGEPSRAWAPAGPRRARGYQSMAEVPAGRWALRWTSPHRPATGHPVIVLVPSGTHLLGDGPADRRGPGRFVGPLDHGARGTHRDHRPDGHRPDRPRQPSG